MIYLDNAATTPMSENVKAAIRNSMDLFGNPSTVSAGGTAARVAIEEARKICAASINAEPDEIYFTSGGTESDNWAVDSSVGMATTGENEIALVTSEFEHRALLARADYMIDNGMRVEYLPVSQYGAVSISSLIRILKDYQIRLVSVMMVNNELGTIQDIERIAEICHEHGVLFHTDAVQAYGKIGIDVKELGVDMLSISGHKVHAPKGVGFLYCRRGVTMKPLLWGGGQERGLRSGTENILGIIGLGEAAKDIHPYDDALMHFDKGIWCSSAIMYLKQYCPEFELNVPGMGDFRAGIINFNVGSIDGAGLVSLLDSEGVTISNGSACDTKTIHPSHVLKAIGLTDEKAMNSFRVSISGNETVKDAKHFAEKFAECFHRLKKIEEVNKYGEDI